MLPQAEEEPWIKREHHEGPPCRYGPWQAKRSYFPARERFLLVLDTPASYPEGDHQTQEPPPCRFRSERVPLFRASGDHLSGCGAIRLTMLRDRANSPAWLAPARWLRGVAIGGPRPKRCPVEHPRDVTVELLAQRDGSLEEAQPGRRGVQIQLITT